MLFDDLSYMFSKKYPVSDIYVGELGYVTKDGNHIKINGTEDFIIFRKVKFDNFDYMGKDFFTNKNYFFWDGNKYPGDTIWRAIDGYAIFFSVPIEQFLSSPKKYISKKELLDLYNELNKPKLEQPKAEATSITDTILKTIIETGNKLSKIAMDDAIKATFIKELEELAEYYVTEMTRKMDEQGNELSIDEYSIRMEVICTLADIELRINNPEHVRNYSLIRQLKVTKNQLRENQD